MTRFDLRDRLYVALLHGTGSVAVAGLGFILAFHLWHPGPYARISGGIALLQLIVAADLALGPLAVFAIFDRRKGSSVLRRDLVVLLLLRAVALAYGLLVLFEARPVALVLEHNRFRVLSAGELITTELPQAPEGLQELPFAGPMLLRTEVPEDPTERFEALTAALSSGADLAMRPRYWRAWDAQAREQVRAEARPLDGLLGTQPDAATVLAAAVAATGVPRERLRYLPLLARKAKWVVLIDLESGAPAGFAALIGD